MLQIVCILLLLSLGNGQKLLFKYNECTSIDNNKEKLYKLAFEGAKSNEAEQQNEVLKLMKKLVATLKSDDIIEYQFLPKIIGFFNSPNLTIQQEAALFLQYFAKDSSKNAKEIAENGAVPHFLKLLSTSDEKLVISSLSFFTTILHLHDQYNEFELVKNIKILIDSKPSEDSISAAVTLLYKLTQINLKEGTVKKILPTLIKLMNHHKPEIVKKACLTISAMAQNGQHQHHFDKEEIIEKFMKFLKITDKNVQLTALLVIGNTINDKNEQFLIDNGILKFMPSILKSNDPEVVKLGMDALRNLIVGSKTKIMEKVDPKIIPVIAAQLSKTDGPEDITLLLLNYFAINGNDKHITTIIKSNVITDFCKILKKNKSKNVNSVYTILIGYYSIIQKAGIHKCTIFDQLEKCGGIDLLYGLEDFTNIKIRKLALKLLAFHDLHESEGTCSK